MRSKDCAGSAVVSNVRRGARTSKSEESGEIGLSAMMRRMDARSSSMVGWAIGPPDITQPLNAKALSRAIGNAARRGSATLCPPLFRLNSFFA
jgi:hypothetical protein